MNPRSAVVALALLALAAPSAGCNREASKVSDRFLAALARDEYAAAFAELHSDALPYTPDAATLRDRMEKSGVQLVGWSWTCGIGGATPRTGYSVTTQKRAGVASPKRPLVIGVAAERRGKCNGPLVVDLKQDAKLPGEPWKVRTFQLD